MSKPIDYSRHLEYKAKANEFDMFIVSHKELFDALGNIENDDKRIPEKLWKQVKQALSNAYNLTGYKPR